jgi:hypothetical protein
MVLNLHSSSVGALGDEVGGEAVVAVMNTRRSRVAEWNVLENLQDR